MSWDEQIKRVLIYILPIPIIQILLIILKEVRFRMRMLWKSIEKKISEKRKIKRALKDLETIESRIQKVQKQAQTGGDKAAKQAYDVLVQFKDALEQGKSARTVTFETKDEQKIAKELFLLTSKPVMYVCNVDEASAVNGNKYVDMVREAVKDEDAEILVVAGKTEADIAELEYDCYFS